MTDLDVIRSYVAEGIPEFDAAFKRVCVAIGLWYADWDNHYDGEPLKDHEVKMLQVMGRLNR